MIELLINDFKKVLELSGLNPGDYVIHFEVTGVPHQVPKWRNGFSAIYIFHYGDSVLKIGKAGSKSKLRFTSQHYSAKAAKSTLARSLVNDEEFAKSHNVNEKNIADWIKNNTARTSLFVDANYGVFVLNLLEAFLHCRLKPVYEGFKSQTS
ncbi:hypothetical protein [Methylophaga sp. OBS3]|uniref:hypothetical protein n=1 Tax=Methylophaga sp. OBS3 TaxID=2991934 RepID=UPI0022501557|nr:hypothetical protein [Methylophaga sp. OBS3]MCX4190819.1 hypothetical protein [Methylophaga sp. OBS3]